MWQARGPDCLVCGPDCHVCGSDCLVCGSDCLMCGPDCLHAELTVVCMAGARDHRGGAERGEEGRQPYWSGLSYLWT